jgi:hypothetical protein
MPEGDDRLAAGRDDGVVVLGPSTSQRTVPAQPRDGRIGRPGDEAGLEALERVR